MTEYATAKESWYLRLNPSGRIPTIDDEGFVIWETSAILIYLAEKYRSPLYPATMEDKGRMLRWVLFVANDVETPLTTVVHHRFRLPPDKRDPKLADEAEPRLLSSLEIIEGRLGVTPFLQGAQWGVADLVVAGALFSLHTMNYDKLDLLPKLKAWLTASVNRPKAKEAIKLRTG
jgi:glutathione S-transferase